MKHTLKDIGKLMSLVLRHKPEEIGLQLNENGWATVQELVEKINARGIAVTIDTIREVVATNNKKRFAFNSDETMIRASQGHSIDVELNLKVTVPPAILYHGTPTRFLASILATGLQKQTRQHVHLSAATETAVAVGSRHGKPVVLEINAKAMHEAGFEFFLSDNNVWLTTLVPVEYISQ